MYFLSLRWRTRLIPPSRRVPIRAEKKRTDKWQFIFYEQNCGLPSSVRWHTGYINVNRISTISAIYSVQNWVSFSIQNLYWSLPLVNFHVTSYGMNTKMILNYATSGVQEDINKIQRYSIIQEKRERPLVKLPSLMILLHASFLKDINA